MWWKWALVLAASVGMLQLGFCFSKARTLVKLIPAMGMLVGACACGIWYLVTAQPGAKLVAGIAAPVFLGLAAVCALAFPAQRVLTLLLKKFFPGDKE